MNSIHSTQAAATAYHEAGHAVVGALRGLAPISVTIAPDKYALGKTKFPDWLPEFKNHYGDSPEKRCYIETRILIAIAGTTAHAIQFPEHPRDVGDIYDERRARDIIEENAGWADDCRDQYFEQLQELCQKLLQQNWPWVHAVAFALLERTTISNAEVMEMLPKATCWPVN